MLDILLNMFFFYESGYFIELKIYIIIIGETYFILSTCGSKPKNNFGIATFF